MYRLSCDSPGSLGQAPKRSLAAILEDAYSSLEDGVFREGGAVV
jgi:hypothetical protein